MPLTSIVPFEVCPIAATLKSFGRKWALPVLRDVAFLREPTFGQILRRSPGLTPRALSLQLRNLRHEGAIVRVADPLDRRRVRYRLTRRGRDAVPILTALVEYGIRYHADRVFEDRLPRRLASIYPGEQPFLLGALDQYARSPAPTSKGSPSRTRSRPSQ
ncbi:MAG: winged helix-turn-helix transcriptional regulator [Thermoplasmata archaeon]